MLATHGPELIPAARQLSEQIFTRLAMPLSPASASGSYRAISTRLSAQSPSSHRFAYLILAWPVATILLQREKEGIPRPTSKRSRNTPPALHSAPYAPLPATLPYSISVEASARTSE
jgi:hypothetical protein